MLVLIALGLALTGVSVKGFQFHFEGLSAAFMQATGQDTQRRYSFFDLGSDLASSTVEPSLNDSVRWLQFIFYFFGLGVPVVYFVALVVLWIMPLSPKAQFVGFVGSQILGSWASLDVFALTLLVSTFEIAKFVAYIQTDGKLAIICDQFLSQNFHIKCFKVHAVVNAGTVLLVLSGICSLLVGQLVFWRVHKAMERASRANSAPVSLDAPRRIDQERGRTTGQLVDPPRYY